MDLFVGFYLIGCYRPKEPALVPFKLTIAGEYNVKMEVYFSKGPIGDSEY